MCDDYTSVKECFQLVFAYDIIPKMTARRERDTISSSDSLSGQEVLAKKPPVRILAIGSGALQRALIHPFIEALNAQGNYNGSIFIGQPRGSKTADAINHLTDGFSVVSFLSEGVASIQQVKSVVGAESLSIPIGRQRFIARTEQDLDLILVGVTEKGVSYGEPGMEVLFDTLRSYFTHHGQESTIAVLDTDNIQGNGDTIKEIILRYAKEAEVDPQEVSWLSNNVAFINSMVDRIVPQAASVPEPIRQAARNTLGVSKGDPEDTVLTYTEPLPEVWALVIEEDERLRVPFGKLGSPQVVVTKDIKPYHEWKLRLANALHVPGITTLMSLAFGENALINEALKNDSVRRHAEEFAIATAKVVSKDTPIEGMNAEAYALQFLKRVAQLPDGVKRININLSVKLQQRIADTVLSPDYECLTNRERNRLAFSAATVFRFLTPVGGLSEGYNGLDDQKNLYIFNDPKPSIPEALSDIVSEDELTKVMNKILSDPSLWSTGQEERRLSDNDDFTMRVTNFYSQLTQGTKVLDILQTIDAS